ncbi:hypothetical protein GF415_05490 [Candidatus Micrarchaeota archaeon]|nr:hypothetical protein [Candidatus Micrarchaeota archaeon]
MAPSDQQPRSRARSPASSNPTSPISRVIDEGASDITKNISFLEKTRRTLRLLSPNISENRLLHPVTGGDPTRFLLAVVSSMSEAEKRWSGNRELTLIRTRESLYIDPPREGRRKPSPVMAGSFLLSPIPPSSVARDKALSQFIHNIFIEIAQDGGKKLYLFPVENGIKGALQKFPAGKEEQEKKEQPRLSALTPASVSEARRVLLEHEVQGGAPLDLERIHDNLEEAVSNTFDDDSIRPFSTLKLSGGAVFRLYPYGKYPPDAGIPEGCELILSQENYYLVMPEMVAARLSEQLLSSHLSSK